MNGESCVCETPASTVYEVRHWPVNWSAVFAGSLAALAVALVAGLASIAVGAQIVGHNEHIVAWNRVHFGGIIWAVCSAFLSFVVGGWVAGKITGHTRAEHAMLHAVMAWLVAIPFFIFIASLGAGGYLGGWYAGLAGTPVWVTNAPALPNDVAYAVVRNNALGALTALILGLIGSVLGGWLASGQPMHFWSTSPTTTTTTTHADGRVIVAH
jgi:hypothetical protein